MINAAMSSTTEMIVIGVRVVMRGVKRPLDSCSTPLRNTLSKWNPTPTSTSSTAMKTT